MDATAAMPTLDGAEHHYVEVRGARLHVAELGDPDGPAVLLLHGWPQHWWSWRLLMPLLADRYRVLAMDLRGFGWSEATARGYRKDELAEDVVGVLDALGVDRVNLVGHDWGGVIGFLVCLEHPDRVARFVPMNTGHVWPKLSLKGVPKQLGAMTYQGLLASPGVGRRVNASPRSTRPSSRRASPTPPARGRRRRCTAASCSTSIRAGCAASTPAGA
jgi:pimeloyl-ACP methyl ester carboxylesterase